MARGLPGDGPWTPAKERLSKNPILRDTATVNAGSYLVVRFLANNPGTWIMHCTSRSVDSDGDVARGAGWRACA